MRKTLYESGTERREKKATGTARPKPSLAKTANAGAAERDGQRGCDMLIIKRNPRVHSGNIKKAWVTRRANEAKVAGTFPEERMEERNRKYPSNPRIDDAIREAYRQFREEKSRTAIADLARRLGWPRYRVNRRARAIGLAHTKEAYWSQTEEWVLQRWGHLTDAAIRTKLEKAGYKRSLTAVNLKVRRLRIKQNLDGYSANRLAEAFGIDRHIIARWIRLGYLRAERRGTARTEAQGGDMYWIRRDDVRTFILGNPEEVDLAKVEKIWFLDLITNGNLLGTGKSARTRA